MRTTLTLADDLAAAVEALRRERSSGISEAVNELCRAGLVRRERPEPFVQPTHDVGVAVDVTDVQEAIEALDGPRAP